jgi:hypothetical protein
MQNNLRKRGSKYYFRRRIPLDLVAHYGKDELSYSLHTSDYAVAKVLASAETTKTDAEFLKLRASRQPSAAMKSALLGGVADAVEMRDAWFAEYQANREHHQATDAMIRQAEAVQEATGQARAVPIPLDPLPADKAPGEHRKTLRHVVPSWVTRNGPGGDAKKRTNRALELFEEAVGVLPVRDLKKAHGATFVRFLLDSEKRGLASNTCSPQFAPLAGMLATLSNTYTSKDVDALCAYRRLARPNSAAP